MPRCSRRVIDTPSTAANRSRIRDRHGSPTGFMARRIAWTFGSRLTRGAGFAAKALRDAVIYELHVGTFTPEGTYAAAQAKACALGAAWRHARRTHASGDISGPARLGIRRGGSVCAVSRLRLAATARLIRAGLPCTRVSACCWMWSTTIWDRMEIIWRSTAPISPTGTKPIGARRSTTTDRTAIRCAVS